MNPNSSIDITIGGRGSDNFTVEALVADGKISVAVASVTGLMDEIIQSITVYPNPAAAEEITVAFLEDTALDGKIDLQLFDITGNLALRKTVDAADLKYDNEVHLAIDGLQQGTYLLKLFQTTKELGTVRLIIH